MSGIFGGGNAKNQPEQVYVPPFESAGGVTPQQQSLGQFSLGEDLLAQSNLFGSENLGESTMATQGAEGAQNTAAMQMAGMSDVNQGAQYQLNQNDLQSLVAQLQEATATGSTPSTLSPEGLGSTGGFGVNPNASLVG